jgi:murein DD-endopeptidase MepM/ murein hydrolase activator NlpD
MNKNSPTYTIMIIPEQNGEKSFSIRVSRTVIILLVVVLSVIAAATGFITLKSAQAAKKLHYFSVLTKDNEFLSRENAQLRLIHQKIGRIDTVASYLENLSALSPIADKANAPTLIREENIRAKTTDKPIAVEKNSERTANDKSSAIRGTADLSDETVPMVLPVEGWITQQFTEDTTQGGSVHPGIDIAAAEGMMIKAPAAGTVMDVEADQYYGNLIGIKHNNGLITRYGHCAKVLVVKNEKVERGQTIALVGNTGHSTAPHLHYEIIMNGKNVNPLEFTASKKK